MWENVSSIIAQFSKSQKIIALLIVILGIVIVGATPPLISSITTDCKDLESRVSRYESRIKELENQVDTLNFKIRKSQTECTDLVLERESRFYEMLEELKKEAKGNEPNRYNTQYLVRDNFSDSGEGPVVLSAPSPEPVSEIRNNSILRKIEKMQKEIKKK